MNWHIQYLEGEKLWYLTNHTDDGISFEGWYYTSSELLTDLNKYLNNIDEREAKRVS
jgi:hypothetical protein